MASNKIVLPAQDRWKTCICMPCHQPMVISWSRETGTGATPTIATRDKIPTICMYVCRPYTSKCGVKFTHATPPLELANEDHCQGAKVWYAHRVFIHTGRSINGAVRQMEVETDA